MRRNRAKQRGAARGTAQPPQIVSSIRTDHVFRYTSVAAAVGTSISIRNLMETWLNTPTAVTANLMAIAVKIRRIEVWAGPSATLAPVSVGIDWIGATGFAGNNAKHTDTSVGATRVAHVNTSPPKLSQVAMWQQVGNSSMFVIDCPAGSVIDLHLSFMVRDDGTAVAATNAPVGATPGANYFRSFDGLATAAGNFVPVGYPQI